MKKSEITGNLACLGAYLIFGFNIVCCKSIANTGLITPIALFCLRSASAMVLFFIASLFVKDEHKMEKDDLWKVAVASFLGIFLCQMSFLKAITMTTAVDASILSLMSPIMTMIIAAIVLNDKITKNGVIGLSVSFAGVLFIVLNTAPSGGGADSTTLPGVLLMVVNALSFASYLGIFKPLIAKYNVVTFMKWMFLFATLYALPFGIHDVAAIPYGRITPDIAVQLAFVIVFATFVAYFLIPFGQKRIRPVIVCMYSYVQPVIAMGISLAVGLDKLTWPKVLASVLVFAGVSIVNFARK